MAAILVDFVTRSHVLPERTKSVHPKMHYRIFRHAQLGGNF